MKLERLYKLYHHLKYGKLGHQVFDFGCFNAVKKELLPGEIDIYKYTAGPELNKCGTMGCAAGELPIVDRRNWKFETNTIRLRNNSQDNIEDDLGIYFDLSNREINHLFYPEMQSPESFGGRHLNGKATKDEVADNMLEFINLKLSGKF